MTMPRKRWVQETWKDDLATPMGKGYWNGHPCRDMRVRKAVETTTREDGPNASME